MLLLYRNNRLSRLATLHSIVYAPKGLFRLLQNLPHIMLKKRFALRCIDQKIAAF